ncbi:type II secretion system protein N [Dyella tabacisoli]|uniref:Type II secretion system protein N n=1 Tax=Dyella tabacisoli TaxID=2282381 RepID=A0A369URT4_9GAMM|nr:type II secretion system protein N [Dyella tabacisoli]RDD82448.1 type II secretion system protein N [Dyella tabacisoli]
MKRLGTVLIVLGALLLLALLVWYLPAQWMQSRLEARLHGLRLDQVGGTLWEGHAGQVLTTDGRNLGRLEWQLSRRALWGDTRFSAGLEGPQLSFHGDMHQLDKQRAEWSQVHLRGDIASLGLHTEWLGGGLHGQLNIEIAHVLLQGRWPLELDGSARWSDAAAGALALGEIQLQAQGRAGVIQGELQDGGNGPLQLNGQLGLSPLGWRYSVNAKPRGANPALQRWLLGLGRAGADGAVQIKGSGGLAKAAGDKKA